MPMKKAFISKAFKLLNNKKCSKTNSCCTHTDTPSPKGELLVGFTLPRPHKKTYNNLTEQNESFYTYPGSPFSGGGGLLLRS
jgi:hypothetical protein